MNHLKTHQTNPTTAQYRPVQSNTSTAQYSQVQPIPEPDPKPELFGQTRPEPDPKSKSPTRQSLMMGWQWFSMEANHWLDKMYVKNKQRLFVCSYHSLLILPLQ